MKTIPELEKEIHSLTEALQKVVQANTELYHNLEELRKQLGVPRLPQSK